MISLFLSFVQVGLLSVGGGYAAIPIIREQTVLQHAWLTMEEFADLVTIAEMTPGPIAVNVATFIGMRLAGIAGAIAATLGCILPSVLLLSWMAQVYTRHRSSKTLQDVLGILRCAIAALIAQAGLSMVKMVAGSGKAVGLCLFFTALFLLRTVKCSPVLVIALSGLMGLILQV